MISLISIIPTEKTVSKSVPYQEAVYKTVEKTTYVDKTETRYKTEIVTKYKTIYYGTLKNSQSWQSRITGGSDQIWTIDNAISWEKQYSRQGSSAEYTFTITNVDGTKSYYYDIDWWNINQREMPYTENVKVPYEVTVSVPIIVSEQAIDRYDTKFKTEYVKEKKPLILWIIEDIKIQL